MNFSRYDPGQARAPFLRNTALRAVRAVLWAVVNVSLVAIELVAEFVAPLMVLAGAAWWALPRALGAVVLEGQAGEVLREVTARLPREIVFAGSEWTAAGVIATGLWLFVLVAVCRTLAALAARGLLD